VADLGVRPSQGLETHSHPLRSRSGSFSSAAATASYFAVQSNPVRVSSFAWLVSNAGVPIAVEFEIMRPFVAAKWGFRQQG
jgi:hypothetical protein